jgi:hypothetical protein
MSQGAAKRGNLARGIRLPRRDASDQELSDFFDRHEGFDLLDRGIMQVDRDREDLSRMHQGKRRGAKP